MATSNSSKVATSTTTSILSVAATPVSLSHKQDLEKARQTTAICGRKCVESYRKSGRVGLFAKMLMGTSIWGSSRRALTWKVQAMTSSRLLFRLSVSTRSTSGIGCGLLDTPTAKYGQSTVNLARALLPTPMAADGSGNRSSKGAKFRPSLRTMAAKNLWPTPTVSTATGAPKNRYLGSPTYRNNLSEALRESPTCGQLSPIFVEWLMGYPEGWSDLED